MPPFNAYQMGAWMPSQAPKGKAGAKGRGRGYTQGPWAMMEAAYGAPPHCFGPNGGMGFDGTHPAGAGHPAQPAPQHGNIDHNITYVGSLPRKDRCSILMRCEPKVFNPWALKGLSDAVRKSRARENRPGLLARRFAQSF